MISVTGCQFVRQLVVAVVGYCLAILLSARPYTSLFSPGLLTGMRCSSTSAPKRFPQPSPPPDHEPQSRLQWRFSHKNRMQLTYSQWPPDPHLPRHHAHELVRSRRNHLKLEDNTVHYIPSHASNRVELKIMTSMLYMGVQIQPQPLLQLVTLDMVRERIYYFGQLLTHLSYIYLHPRAPTTYDGCLACEVDALKRILTGGEISTHSSASDRQSFTHSLHSSVSHAADLLLSYVNFSHIECRKVISYRAR